MENLFLTFDSMVSAASFVDLSSNVFSWVEEHCKPQVQVCIGHISITLLIIFCVGCRVWKTWQWVYFRRSWLGPIESSREGWTPRTSLSICHTTSDHYCRNPSTLRQRSLGKYYTSSRGLCEKPPKKFLNSTDCNVLVCVKLCYYPE
jgi:hypothetical protein